MPNNEITSKRVASIAAKVLRTGKATPEEARILAACALTQALDRDASKGAKK